MQYNEKVFFNYLCLKLKLPINSSEFIQLCNILIIKIHDKWARAAPLMSKFFLKNHADYL